MNTVKKINQQAQKLPEQSQKEVLDFIDFMLSKTLRESTRQDNLDWYKFSLTSAMHGIENEETVTYDESDLKVVKSYEPYATGEYSQVSL